MGSLNDQSHHNRDGFSILEIVISIGILAIVAMASMQLIGNQSKAMRGTLERGDVEAIRRTILNRLSCEKTLAQLVNPADCDGMVDLLDEQGHVIIQAQGTKFGPWTLRCRCQSGSVYVEGARLKDGASVSSQSADAFFTDKLTNKPVDWSAGKAWFFADGESPCEVHAQYLPMRHFRVFSTPGTDTFQVPARVTQVKAEVWGAGGGGGGGSHYGVGAGGGGGSYGSSYVAVNPGDVMTVVVGAPGTASCAQGLPGAESRFANVKAGGGAVGQYAWGAAGVAWIEGGIGGIATATIIANGGSGYEGIQNVGGGFGGAAGRLGLGGRPGNAPNGGFPGGGGAGGVQTSGNACSSGGAGAAGRVVIWYP